MQIEERSLEQGTDAPSESWFAPLAMFIAWLARMFDHIAKMKRVRITTKFKSNWRDHFAGLRLSEWHRDQIMAEAAAQLLAGKEPDLYAIGLCYDPPDDHGGPCPRTPFDLNRRMLYLARWHADPMFFIRRHAHRIAKREACPSIGPLRLAAAQRSTSPGYAGGDNAPAPIASLSRTATGGDGMRVFAHDGGGLAFIRGPPSPIKIRSQKLAATCENASLRLSASAQTPYRPNTRLRTSRSGPCRPA
jgi:hypothetical protein